VVVIMPISTFEGDGTMDKFHPDPMAARIGRRAFLQIVGAGLAMCAAPAVLKAAAFKLDEADVFLECLGDVPGPRFLDGRTGDGSVGLVNRLEHFSGTRWRVHANETGQMFLECKGKVAGPRFLDGRTANASVGLAPHTKPPFTGTVWDVTEVREDIYTLKCLGHIEGARFLDGRTGDGSVGLAPNTQRPFTGTRWRMRRYPVCFDEPCGLR
jgi:hypothetical protein